MSLQDPVVLFTASSNVRAQTLCHLLAQSGVEAHLTEDLSLVGLWVGGTIPGIHAPKIWVERADAERAAAILQLHELREKELRGESPSVSAAEALQEVCEECGQVAAFSFSQRGSVQNCPHCGAYLDVGSEEQVDDWEADDEESSAESSEE